MSLILPSLIAVMRLACVYVYVCKHVCMYVCVCVCMYVRLGLIGGRSEISLSLILPSLIAVMRLVYVCMYVCMHVCMYVCMYTTHTGAYMYVYCAYMHIK